VQFHVLRLDDLPAALHIAAERLSGDATQVLYRFTLSSDGTPVLDGRAAVILDAGALS
jgi:predicted hotdog family 3-hydroxylacyl-ACP dehydratase